MWDQVVHAGDTGGSGFRSGWEERVNIRNRGFPGATTQIWKKIPIIEEVPPEDFRDAKDVMSVSPCNFFQSPPSKF